MANPGDDFDYIFKIVLAGESGVGKSCLLSRYARNEFTLETKPTIGVEFLTKMVEMPGDDPSEKPKFVKSQIWDTAGQERFRAITSAYYRGALGVVVCYDITRRKSFESVNTWLAEMRANCEPVVTMLVGTKIDLQYLREVSTEEAVEYAQREHMLFMETSAQSAVNVEEAFTEVTKTIFQHIHKDLDQDDPHETDQVLSKDKFKILHDGNEEVVVVPHTKQGCCGK